MAALRLVCLWVALISLAAVPANTQEVQRRTSAYIRRHDVTGEPTDQVVANRQQSEPVVAVEIGQHGQAMKAAPVKTRGRAPVKTDSEDEGADDPQDLAEDEGVARRNSTANTTANGSSHHHHAGNGGHHHQHAGSGSHHHHHAGNGTHNSSGGINNSASATPAPTPSPVPTTTTTVTMTTVTERHYDSIADFIGPPVWSPSPYPASPRHDQQVYELSGSGGYFEEHTANYTYEEAVTDTLITGTPSDDDLLLYAKQLEACINPDEIAVMDKREMTHQAPAKVSLQADGMAKNCGANAMFIGNFPNGKLDACAEAVASNQSCSDEFTVTNKMDPADNETVNDPTAYDCFCVPTWESNGCEKTTARSSCIYELNPSGDHGNMSISHSSSSSGSSSSSSSSSSGSLLEEDSVLDSSSSSGDHSGSHDD